MMNEKQKAYILANWDNYNAVDSREDMIKLLNILEAHGETLDSFHDASFNRSRDFFCGIYGEFENDRDTANTLFDYNVFYTDEEQMRERVKDDADYEGETVDAFLEGEDIRKTSDGIVRVLHY